MATRYAVNEAGVGTSLATPTVKSSHPPVITDPFCYLVTVPAVLLLGISKSGFGAGFGALAVPMMAMAVSVPQAAAILMPVLLLMDVLGMAVFPARTSTVRS